LELGYEMKFKILHTSDVLSRFENYAKIVAKIKELRDGNRLVLDAGDFNDFMRMEFKEQWERQEVNF
jgi:5'-nucleotidase